MSIKPVTLDFSDEEVELKYQAYLLDSIKRRARFGVMMALALWIIIGVLDSFFISYTLRQEIIFIHAVVIAGAAFVILMTFYKYFDAINQTLIALVVLAGGAGLLAKMWFLPESAIAHYFPGLMFLIFWSHTYSGLRFINAVSMTIFVSLMFDVLFFSQRPIPIADISVYNLYLIGANMLAAFASYAAERQERQLFLRSNSLDEERRHHLTRALHDNLTGLPNRELLEDRLSLAISQSTRDERLSAGLFIDLDHFKEINDEYGHGVGDLFLKEVAARLKDIMREADTLSRIGGDEFFVLARDINNKESASTLAEKLLQQLQQPYYLADGLTIPTITASIGICLFPYAQVSPADIVRRADYAMYK
ncbi:MAG: GGDEF domain-containing protein, partial [Nitrosomonadales bacterium]|nr:GGDEF domain-containing protein [Nitrosomonadales bacterium]